MRIIGGIGPRPEVKRPNSSLSSHCFGRGRVLDELRHDVRHLGANAGPVVDTIALEANRCRFRTRVVGTNHFDGAAIAGAVLFDHNDAVVGLLTRSNARQTNHDHLVTSSLTNNVLVMAGAQGSGNCAVPVTDGGARNTFQPIYCGLFRTKIQGEISTILQEAYPRAFPDWSS